VAYDEMARAPVLTRALAFKDDRSQVPRPLRDDDVIAVQEYLQKRGLSRLGTDTLHAAVMLRARECSYHPVRTYLSSLEWDGEPRLDAWLTTYLGAEDTGSGKTEAFLLPILGKLANEAKSNPATFADQPAVRALILYPMNALVNDQLGRLRGIFGDPRTVALFKKWARRPARFAR
jgi:hypothetical protein